MSVTVQRIGDFLEDVRSSKYYLPAIQRELVWGTDRIVKLFDSLLRGYPVGTMLRWKVPSEHFQDFTFYELVREFDVRKPHNVKADLGAASECYGVLDGQQRTTALNIGMRGSFTSKLPYKRSKNRNAYPELELHLNLLHKPSADADMKYAFRFRPQNQEAGAGEFWFRVGDMLQYRDEQKLRDYRRASAHRNSEEFEDNLSALYNAVWRDSHVHFYTETSTDLDEVLRIFVRLNSGGIALSYSDLLFSLLTAAWKTHDARQVINALVDELKQKCGASFSFDKDFVLRALLLCRNKDVRFKTLNFGKQADLEGIWLKVAEALRMAVRIVVRCGFSAQTLRAPTAVLAVAYFLYLLDDARAVEGKAYEADREKIRVWLLQCFLGQVFGGRTEQLLVAIRTAINESWTSGERGFPSALINSKLRQLRAFAFDDEVLTQIIDETNYGHPNAFFVLALLTPSLRADVALFDVDHLHPRSMADKNEELKQAGLCNEDITFYKSHVDGLPNLHLLQESENKGNKRARPLKDWIENHPSAVWIRQTSFLPDDDATDIKEFRTFYTNRRNALLTQLKSVLGSQLVAVQNDDSESPEDSDLLATVE
jgi:hypothetical protein